MKSWMRMASVCLTLMLCSAAAGAQDVLTVRKLRCEYKVDPVGIDIAKPRFSWQLKSTEKNVLQTSYELQVAQSQKDLDKEKLLWTTGKVDSDASHGVEYAGPSLASEHIYYWRVRVSDNHSHTTLWSQPAKWEMALLQPADWKATWITPNLPEDETKSNPAPLLRREFTLNAKKKIELARLFASAMGLYELHLNGHRVGDQYFTPGWTAYDFRYQYQTFEVTDML